MPTVEELRQQLIKDLNKSTKLTELQQRIQINKYKLDDELIEQPRLFEDVAQGYADAASKRDQSKAFLEELDAGISKQLREEAANMGKKITESQLDDEVKHNPEHVNQMELHLAYKHDADRWHGLFEAFNQRASMLHNLVKLYCTGYFGSVPIKPNDPNFNDALANQANLRQMINQGDD
jgi:hypothetical protein